MNKWTKIVLFIGIAFTLIGWGKYIIPTHIEISDVQVVRVMGMDSSPDNGVSFSILFQPPKGVEEEGDNKEKYLIVSANSFASTSRGLQHCEDKLFIGSHVDDILLGEKLAQDNLAHAMEFISKNDEFRLDSKVYIVKEMSTSKVFEDGLGNGYILSDRINKLSLTKKGDVDVRTVEVLDVLKILLSEDKVGVIPCIQVIRNGEEQLADYKIVGAKEEANRVELAGYGVINKGRLVGYLNNDESTGYEYIKNLISEEGISLNTKNGVVGINLTAANSKIKFDFDGDNIKKVTINVTTKNSILETATGKNIFNSGIDEIEKMENEKLEEIIKSTVRYAQNSNIDFIDIGNSLAFSHPYKWRKIKDHWDEIFPGITIDVKVNSRIEEEYGVLSIAKEG